MIFDILLAPRAYLDPGSGSYILQFLLATLVGGIFILKLMWGRITGFFRRGAPQDEPQDSPDPNDTEQE